MRLLSQARRPVSSTAEAPFASSVRRERRTVLFVNTPTRPPLGADTWIHGRIMAALDREAYEPVSACVFGPTGARTPTYELLHRLPGLELRPTSFGPELNGLRGRARRRAVLSTVAALGSIGRLAWFVRRRRIPIIHTSDRPRDAAVCVVLARLTGAKCVVHVHVGVGDWMQGMLRWALRRADALVAVSTFVAETLVQSGHRPDRVHVVLNAIEPERWTPGLGRADARSELGIGPDDPVVITVCRLFPAKGPAELVRAISVLRDRHPAVRLVVVGGEMTPGFRAELEALVTSCDAERNVIFTGRRDDVERLMGAADVYAMPSLYEPFGLVYAEAMAMRLPVVALDNGGTPEVVEHGVTGLLSPAGDHDALVKHLGVLLDDPAYRDALGSAGRARVERHFTAQRMARDVAAVYERIGHT